MAFGQLKMKFRVQVTVCLVCVVVTATLYSQLYKTNTPSYVSVKATGRNTSITEEFRTINNKSANSSPTMTILSYSLSRWINEWVGHRWDTSDVFQSCPSSKNCILSKNKSIVNEADAVIFNWKTLCGLKKNRKQSQVWIFFEYESPDYYPRVSFNNNCGRSNVVNWTFTYRRDSDFTLVHGKFLPHDTDYNVKEHYQLLRSKTKTAVGFISHCNAPSKRDTFIRKLRAYGVDIDVYGRCGNLKCGGEFENKWKGVWNVTAGHEDHCFDVLDTKYKFYISFENSLCKDYVTEKSLHLVLRRQIVPVIRDGSNRSLFHPPHSFLDTKNFKNIRSLAKHIKFLSNNFDQYLTFFNWRKHYKIETISRVLQSVYCDMCHRMHHQNRYRRVYKNLNAFFSKSHDTRSEGICKKPSDLW